jgi:hypothetical protein
MAETHPEPVSLTDQPGVTISSFLHRPVIWSRRRRHDADVASWAGTSSCKIITAVTAAHLNRMTGADEVILGLLVSIRLGLSHETFLGCLPLRLKGGCGSTWMPFRAFTLVNILRPIGKISKVSGGGGGRAGSEDRAGRGSDN